MHELRHMQIANLVMLTGDRRRAAEAIAREIGIPDVEAELLPEQKLDRVKHFAAHGRRVAMVGDGINDAPALAASDVGIAVPGPAISPPKRQTSFISATRSKGCPNYSK